MFARALIAFLALPGMVAFAVPAVWLWNTGNMHLIHPLGLIAFGSGIVGLLWCVRDFYVSGKGTLAPWAPPTHLVVVGLYRFSRNPMYVAVALILLGWASAFASMALFVYLRRSRVSLARRLRRGAVAGAHARRSVAEIRQPRSALVLVARYADASRRRRAGVPIRSRKLLNTSCALPCIASMRASVSARIDSASRPRPAAIKSSR